MLAPLLISLAIKATVAAPAITGNCSPARVHFAGRIESSAAGPVKFTWVRSDKPSTATFDLTFTAPGALPVTYDWMLKGPAEGWVVLQVISPDKVNSGKIRFEVKCK
ncbi:MAG: hypothetical protein ABI759_30735 [Candidatus Solibacter sp.]